MLPGTAAKALKRDYLSPQALETQSYLEGSLIGDKELSITKSMRGGNTFNSKLGLYHVSKRKGEGMSIYENAVQLRSSKRVKSKTRC